MSRYRIHDIRSRRGSLPSSGSGTSDGSSISSMGSNRSELGAEHNISGGSTSDSDSLFLTDSNRVTLQLTADPHEIYPMLDLYQPIINWVDPDLRIFKMNEKADCAIRESDDTGDLNTVPSVAVMVFLHENGMVGCERIQTARAYFENSPWKYHHSEEVRTGLINPYPYNSQDYYYTSNDLPLWAVRQVHCGKEHIRLVLFTSEQNWDDMKSFYELILGSKPEVERSDFCMFTVHSQIHYDVQFALKRVSNKTKVQSLDCVRLQFRVSNLGELVALFPNVCKPLSDTKWMTKDHDGNVICLDVFHSPTKPVDLGRVTRKIRKPPETLGFYV